MKKIFYFLIFPILLFAQNQNEWETYFEKTNFLGSPTYTETMQYFNKLANYSNNAVFVTIGTSPQGRAIKAIIVAKDSAFTPERAKEENKVIVFVENGIHSGEIEGKDATMLLLREILITKEKENLIDNVVFIVIPIFNVDGHERRSKYNRINQNGPTETGWRVTAQNLNLNRDFAKADSPEMKAWLRFYNKWAPDMFVDVHTTDGADYQYTITYGITKHKNLLKCQRDWIRENFTPFVENYVNEKGFLIAPYSYPIKGEFKNGISEWVPSPRFSHGYTAVQNRFGLLIETHMLKPFKDRVFSTKAMLEAILQLFNDKSDEIIEITQKADKEITQLYSAGNYYPIKFTTDLTNGKDFIFKGFQSKNILGKISGDSIISYSSTPIDISTKYYDISKVTDSVLVPEYYVIPQEWQSIVEILKLHNITINRCKKDTSVYAIQTHFSNVTFPNFPYEGRFSPKFDFTTNKVDYIIHKGDYIIPTNQTHVGIIEHLLEPKAPDSFIKWGFFNIIFERKEYFEMYSMEPIAEKMAVNNPDLYKAFKEKLENDSAFASNGRARLNYFYVHSPYYDAKHNVYPIVKVLN